MTQSPHDAYPHTADWQIGRQYGQFDSGDAAMLAEARYDAVARIAELAAQRGVDAVLVAGDVFDTQGISDRGIRRLFGALGAYAGPWVMIAGNHDAALADSVWTRAIQLGCVPANVHAAALRRGGPARRQPGGAGRAAHPAPHLR